MTLRIGAPLWVADVRPALDLELSRQHESQAPTRSERGRAPSACRGHGAVSRTDAFRVRAGPSPPRAPGSQGSLSFHRASADFASRRTERYSAIVPRWRSQGAGRGTMTGVSCGRRMRRRPRSRGHARLAGKLGESRTLRAVRLSVRRDQPMRRGPGHLASRDHRAPLGPRTRCLHRPPAGTVAISNRLGSERPSRAG